MYVAVSVVTDKQTDTHTHTHKMTAVTLAHARRGLTNNYQHDLQSIQKEKAYSQLQVDKI